ncbi:MAG TPA: DUF1326 domain-containing protein [Thermomicrobiales bacterium]|nr:DUF1326 domain-containing protein [Thermomicrobiales bacterium]
MAYRLEGRLLEVCDCNILCPCWVGEDPDNGTCQAIQAYRIDRGAIDGVDVAGLTVAEMDDIPGNILNGNIRGVFFLDEEATPEQERVIRQAWSGAFGGPLADIAALYGEIAWHRAPIVFTVEEGKGTLAIGAAAEAVLEPYRGPTGEPTTLNESIFSTIPGSPAFVGKAERYWRKSAEFGLPNVEELRGHNAIQGYFRFEA